MKLTPSLAFIIILWVLFVFPEIPLPLFKVSRLTFSLALPIFIVWLTFNLSKLPSLTKTCASHYKFTFAFCLFSLWGLAISCLSLKPTAILYALYHSLFIVTSSFIVINLFERSRSQPELLDKLTLHIYLVAIVISIGTIVSVFTGPIYEEQTLWTARHWGDDLMDSGVGFSSNPNQNAVYLCCFFFFLSFLVGYKSTMIKIASISIVGIALLSTLSRTGLSAFFLATAFLVSLFCFSSFKTLTIPKWVFKLIASGIGVCSLFIVYYSINNLIKAEKGLLLGFSSERIIQDLEARFLIWASFVNDYLDSGALAFIFGKGRRMASTIDYWGTWFTPHNAFLSILGEFGLIGFLIITLLLLFLIIHLCKQILKYPPSSTYKFQFCLLFIMAIIFASNAEEHLLSPINGFLIVFCLCLAQFKPIENPRTPI